MKARALLSLLGIVGLVACRDSEPSPSAAVESAKDSLAPAAPEAAAAREQALVTSVTSIRRERDEAAKVAGPDGKQVSNWVATLYRGEVVSVLKVQEDWAQVEASDTNMGWMKKDALLPVEGTTLATVLEPVKTFTRPDLMALNATQKGAGEAAVVTVRTVEPGALLIVLKTKDQFSEVNLQGKSSTWILSEKLSVEANEIAAAKLITKYRWLQEKKDASASQYLELARSQYGSSRLVTMLTAATGNDGDPPAAAGAAPPVGSDTSPP